MTASPATSTAKKLTYRPDRLRKPTAGRRVFQLVNGVVLTGFALICLLPFLHVIGSSLANPGELATRAFVIIPREFTLDAYRYVLSTPTIFRAMGVSMFVTVVGTFLSLLVTSLMAYALGKRYLRGRRVINFLVVFTMLFSGGMIPLFIVVNGLGLLDSIWSLILPGVFAGFNFIVMRSFFMGIPQELTEAARIDGAGDFRILRTIVLPLSKAVIAVIGLFYAVGFWNSFFNAMLYISDQSLWPVQMILRSYVIQGTSLTADQLGVQQAPPPQSIKMAVVVVALAPIVLVYPFLQKYFSKGVITGAIKG